MKSVINISISLVLICFVAVAMSITSVALELVLPGSLVTGMHVSMAFLFGVLSDPFDVKWIE